MAQELTYQNYDSKSLIIYGDKRKFQKKINSIGGRWRSKNNGWFIPVSNTTTLDSLILSFDQNEPAEVTKYRSEDSDTDTESVNSVQNIEEEKPVLEIKEEPLLQNLNESDYQASDED